jgi:4-amino-4-deoxy-L-arabinose transferase-like glycosyltransferase
MAVLMPPSIALSVHVCRRPRHRTRLLPTLIALALLAAPIAFWTVARWRLDQWRFFEALFGCDFIARGRTPLEGHDGGAMFYFHTLAKHQYDWLLAAIAAVVLIPLPWQRKSLPNLERPQHVRPHQAGLPRRHERRGLTSSMRSPTPAPDAAGVC